MKRRVGDTSVLESKVKSWIIKKHEKYIAYWISEPDKRQSDAINKGLKKCTGEIWSYLNSDDILCLNALNQIVKYFKNGINWIGGVLKVFSKDKNLGMGIPNKSNTKKEYLST